MAADAPEKGKAVPTGEEGERLCWKQRCKIYRFHEGQWKQRGVGEITVLQHEDTGMVRLVMRQDKTFKVVLNHFVSPTKDNQLKINFGNDKSRVWSTLDYSDGDQEVMTFAIKFTKSEDAAEFETLFNKGKTINGTEEGDKEQLPKWVDPFADEADADAPAKVDVAPSKDEAKSDDAKADATAKSPSGKELWKSILAEKQYDPFAEDDLKKLWKKYDKDHSDSIDTKELRELYLDLMDALFEKLEASVDEQAKKDVKGEVDDMVKETLDRLDREHDGKLTWAEFKHLTEIKLL